MDYYPETVQSIYQQYSRLKQHVPLVYVKLILFQLARALLQLHQMQITHRDVKPANVLVDPQTLHAVLCDFGSAKVLKQNEPNVSYICSRFYRAPELILGATSYDYKIDIWSYGCILAEILLGRPLFPGENSADQFVEIMKVQGSPSAEEFAAMNPALGDVRFKDIRPYGIARVFRQRTHAEAADLIGRCLRYDPRQRPTAREVLLHPFFDILRTLGARLPGGEPVFGRLYDFTEEERAALGADAGRFRQQERVVMDDMEI